MKVEQVHSHVISVRSRAEQDPGMGHPVRRGVVQNLYQDDLTEKKIEKR